MDLVKKELKLSDGFVSYKSLSVSNGFSPSKAKSMLERYKLDNQHVSAIYCLSGFFEKDTQYEWLIKLVDEKAISTVKKQFVSPPNIFIYALTEKRSSSLAGLATFDSCIYHSNKNSTQMVETQCRPSFETPVKISISENEIMLAERSSSNKPNAGKTKRLSSKQPLKTLVSQVKDTRNQLCLKNLKISDDRKKHVSGDISKSLDIFEEDSSDEKPFLSVSSSLHKRRKIVFSSDEDECDFIPNVLSNNLKTSLKSKRINKKDEQSRKQNDTEENEKKCATSEVQPVAKVSVFNSSILSTSEEIQPLNKQRKEVIKTFVDDEGYLITEKVWESVNVDTIKLISHPTVSTQSIAKSSDTTESLMPTFTKSNPSSTASKKQHVKSKQSSLTNFFKKA